MPKASRFFISKEVFMPVRGIRGAITAEADQPDQVLKAAVQMLQAILAANPTLDPADLASALFTTTPDLISVYPAQAARQMGWTQVPLMCAQEIPVPGSLPLCIRVLLHWNTELPQNQIQHVYLGQAVRLRPDLAK